MAETVVASGDRTRNHAMILDSYTPSCLVGFGIQFATSPFVLLCKRWLFLGILASCLYFQVGHAGEPENAGDAKSLTNVSEDEAIALFRSIENSSLKTKQRSKIFGRRVTSSVQYHARETQELFDGATSVGYILPMTLRAKFRVLGVSFNKTKIFTFEWLRDSQELHASIDQRKRSPHTFNIKVKGRSGAIGIPGVGADGASAKLNLKSKSIYLKNLPSTMVPYLWLNRGGQNQMIQIWVGMALESNVSQTRPAIGIARGSELDLKVGLHENPSGGLSSDAAAFSENATVEVTGDIRAGFTYEQQYVRADLSRGRLAAGRFRRTEPSPVYLDLRPTFSYQIEAPSAGFAAQFSTTSHKVRYQRLRNVVELNHRIKTAFPKRGTLARK